MSRTQAVRTAAVLALFAAAGAVAVSGRAAEAKPDVLRIGSSATIAPPGGKEKAKGAQETLRKFIQDETGLRNEMTTAPCWRGLAESLSKGEVHVGVFQGFEFAWAQEAYPGLKPLALAVNTHRYPVAYVVTKAGGDTKTVADLKGKTVSVPVENQPYLRLFLEGAAGATDGFFGKVAADQSVEDALDDAVDGVVAAAVADKVSLEAFARRKPARYKRLAVVAESKPFPPAVIAVYDDVLDAATRRQFTAGLTGAIQKETGRTMLTLFRLTSFEPPPADFDQVLQATRQAYPPPAAK